VLLAEIIIVLGDMRALRRWFLRRHYIIEQYLEEQIELIPDDILACHRRVRA
jgi:hypothetical protein